MATARVLSNGWVLAGNKLISGSTGGARCYVPPPLTYELLLVLSNYNYVISIINEIMKYFIGPTTLDTLERPLYQIHE